MLPAFKQRFLQQLNPAILSIKYCQNDTRASVEMQFSDRPERTIDLDFMVGEIATDEDGVDKDILPLFRPEADIVDNATSLLQLDDISLIMCLSEILSQEAINIIVAANSRT